MKHYSTTQPEAVAVPSRPHLLTALIGSLGAVSGAGFGALAAGPLGALAGGILGAAVGAGSGWAGDKHMSDKLREQRRLDDEIGVTKGSIGAPNLQHPPVRVGAFSAAASGAAAARPTTPDEAHGPFEPPPP
ncbi:MAG TPA: hypothetical protein VIM73_03470 [Polyangiaceae bacterium]